MKKITGILAVMALMIPAGAASQTLTLDSCRALALKNNKELKIKQVDINRALENYEVARTQYYPRINALGTYMYSTDELSLISKDKKGALSSLGTRGSAQLKQYLSDHPDVAKMIEPYLGKLSSLEAPLNAVGQSLVDALTTDTHNTLVAGLTLTQPVYMGGKIKAYNRITELQVDLSRKAEELERQNLIVEVDEAYWQIVSLGAKKKLAESYLKLVERLDDDVQKMIRTGVSTKADGLSVKVKVNEAKVTIIQIDNAIDISKMKLNQLCGLPLDSPIHPADSDIDAEELSDMNPQALVMEARANRLELQQLDLATKIYEQKERITRSAYMPQVAFTASYLGTYPSVYNGFEKKFNGDFHIGILVKVPVYTFGERKHKMAAARLETEATRLQFDEVKEKVELQVNRNVQLCQEAKDRLATANASQEEANENLRCATVGFSEGVIPVRDVIAAQTAWLKANSTSVSAKIDLKLALIYLQQSCGMLR